MKDHPVVARLLSRRCRQVLRQRTRVLATGDKDAIHDLRVATRRLQEALEFLSPALPARPVRRLGRRARRIRRELGTIRNLDVLVQLVARFSRRLSAPQRRVVAPLAERLAEEATVLRRRDRAGRRRGTMALPGIGKRVRAVQSRIILPADFSVRERARRVLHDRTRDVVDALPPAEGGDAAALHALRIAVKRYRYTLEILDQTGAKKARPAISAARALQTRLGELHDLDVFMELLSRSTSPASRGLVALFGTRRRRLLSQAQAALASFDARRLTRSALGESKEESAA